MKEKINPIGLKGNQITERMKELMGIQPINEDKKTSVVELTKKGPDGKVYGIVRENHEYYIKVTTKQNNLVVEDFQYIGGLQNKKQEAYPSYAKAIKHLNLKFHSLNEAFGKNGNINVFENDKLMKEDWAGFAEMSGPMFKAEGNMDGHMRSECCGAQTMEGMCMECGGSAYGMSGGMEEYDKPAMDSFQKQYGDEKGKNIYYATANKQDRNPETFEKNEGMGMMAEKEFPDLTGDGKVTYADILKGRGVKLDNEGLSPEMEAVDAMMEDDDADYSAPQEGSHVVFTSGVEKKDGAGSTVYIPAGDMGTVVRTEKEFSKFGNITVAVESKERNGEIVYLPFGKKDYSGNSAIMKIEGGNEAVGMMEKEMTDKEKEFAALAEPKDKITYADKIAGATKKEGKLSIERAMDMMDEMIDELHESQSKKKL